MSSVSAMWVPLLFGFALSLGSALGIMLQPMVGRTLLSSLGGTSVGWNAALVFFQSNLLAGFVYAHLLHGFRGLRWQPWMQIALMLATTILCFAGVIGDVVLFDLSSRLTSFDSWPFVTAACMLVIALGLPYLALGALSPLLVRWFAHLEHPKASDPYFLLVASNLGGLTALVIYALMIEPKVPIYAQWMSWKLALSAVGFAVFLAALSVWQSPRNPELEPPPTPSDPNAPVVPTLIGRGSATWPRRWYWFFASALPFGLMMSVTELLTRDTGPAVVFWAVPFGLYLFAFAQAFTRFAPFDSVSATLRRALAGVYGMVLLAGLAFALFAVVRLRGRTDDEKEVVTLICGLVFATLLPAPFRCVLALQPLSVLAVVLVHANVFPVFASTLQSAITLLHVACFYLSARVCFGMLAEDRPAASAITTYFSWIGLGGLFGGMFQLFATPLIFRDGLPFAFMASLACVLRPALLQNGLADWLVWKMFKKTGAEVKPDSTRARRDIAIGFDFGIAFIVAVFAPTALLLRRLVVPIDQGRNAFSDLLVAVNDFPLMLLLTIALFSLARPVRFGLTLAVIVLWCWIGQDSLNDATVLCRERGMFGELHVIERTKATPKIKESFPRGVTERELWQGRGLHGGCVMQPPELLRYSTGRHHRKGPVGRVMRNLGWFSHPEMPQGAQEVDYWVRNNPTNARDDVRLLASLVGQAALPWGSLDQQLGVACWSEPPYAFIGLGTGSLFSYAHPYQWVDAYDRDLAVVAMSEGATPLFHHYQSARERHVGAHIIPGDPRRSLARNRREGFYHAIFVDGLSANGVPVHLLTQEAVELYFHKLTPEGVLCFDVTNSYLDLTPMFRGLAQRHNLALREVHAAPSEELREFSYDDSTTWVLLSRNENVLRKWLEVGGLVNNVGPNNFPLDVRRPPSSPVWTDEHADLLSTARFDQGWPKLIRAMLIMLLLFGVAVGLVELGASMVVRRPTTSPKG